MAFVDPSHINTGVSPVKLFVLHPPSERVHLRATAPHDSASCSDTDLTILPLHTRMGSRYIQGVDSTGTWLICTRSSPRPQ